MRFLNKKAQEGGGPGDKVPWTLILLFYLPLLFFALLYLVNLETQSRTYVPPALKEFQLTQKFTSGPECFVVLDSISGPQAGLIDASRFTAERLRSCYPATKTELAVRLTLSFPQQTLQSANWREDGGVLKRLAPKTVHVKDSAGVHDATLTLELQGGTT